jgi:hypothetical protein
VEGILSGEDILNGVAGNAVWWAICAVITVAIWATRRFLARKSAVRPALASVQQAWHAVTKAAERNLVRRGVKRVPVTYRGLALALEGRNSLDDEYRGILSGLRRTQRQVKRRPDALNEAEAQRFTELAARVTGFLDANRC